MKSLISSSWYRVTGLRPRLRTNARVHRQRFRNEVWYVLQDHQSGQFHRMSPAANQMLCMMDGRRTMQDIWEQLGARLGEGEEHPTQDEIIRLLSQLHAFDLLQNELPADMLELEERAKRKKKQALLMRIKNPLALRFPLLDPDRFLEKTLFLIRPIFTRTGLVLWAMLVVAGAVFAVLHGEALLNDGLANALSMQNLLLMALTYPVIKTIHEFGHAYAARIWGGEVHEMGVMLLVLMPVPYVDASSTSAFRDKWHRIVVSCAGIMVELGLAALAMIFWALAEPGLGRAIAFNVVLIGGVSTLLFNGNPLLRFDGYYALCDLIEIPNLGTRSNRYFFHTLRRLLFGLREEDSPAMAPGEVPWFLFYAVASFLYRLFIMVEIALFIAGQLFFLGVLLAILAIFTTVVWPVCKGIAYLFTNPALQYQRSRSIGVSALVGALMIGGLTLIPLPYSTLAQGVTWLPENSVAVVQEDGFVEEILAPPGTVVTTGTPLIRMWAPELEANLSVLQKELEKLQLQKRSSESMERVRVSFFDEQIRFVQADIDETRRKLENFVIRAGQPGRFVLPYADDLPGHFLQRGQMLGYVVNPGTLMARVVVEQDDIDLIRSRTQAVRVRHTEDLEKVVDAWVIREAPMAQQVLPSAALGTQGGGDIISQSTDEENSRAFESLFQFDLGLAASPEEVFVGSRVYVLFEHEPEPLAFRFARSVRQLFLRQFQI